DALPIYHHAGAAAERGVVDRAMPVVGPLPQVVDVQVHQPFPARLPDEGELEGTEVLGEDRDDVDAHADPQRSVRGGAEVSGSGPCASSSRASNSPPGGSASTTPASRSTSGTSSSTRGSCTRRRSGVRTISRSCAG